MIHDSRSCQKMNLQANRKPTNSIGLVTPVALNVVNSDRGSFWGGGGERGPGMTPKGRDWWRESRNRTCGHSVTAKAAGPDLSANRRLGRNGRLHRLNRPCRPIRRFAAKSGGGRQPGPAGLAANGLAASPASCEGGVRVGVKRFGPGSQIQSCLEIFCLWQKS